MFMLVCPKKLKPLKKNGGSLHKISVIPKRHIFLSTSEIQAESALQLHLDCLFDFESIVMVYHGKMIKTVSELLQSRCWGGVRC